MSNKQKNKGQKNSAVPAGEDVTEHVANHQRVFDDNLFPNRILELLFEICEEQDLTMKQLLRAGVKCIMKEVSDVIEETIQEVIPKDLSNIEIVPINIDEEPTMAQIALCGFNKSLTNMPISPLLKLETFNKWVYQIIKTIPYCYPMRHKKVELQVSGNNDHRINVLATVILGLLWNNKVTFGDKFPKKRPEDPADKIPMFTDDVLKDVKEVIKERARIVRSNYKRSIAGNSKKQSTTKRGRDSVEEESSVVEESPSKRPVLTVEESPSKRPVRSRNSKVIVRQDH